MRKRIFSVFISVVMFLTSLVSITTSAEGTINILETYTFEEFLALSEEEITALSQEAGAHYADGAYLSEANRSMSGCTDRMLQRFFICITEDYSNAIFNQYNSYELSREQTFEEFMLPQTIVTLDGETYSFKYEDEIDLQIDSAVYSDYECIDVLASVYTWLWMNPNVESVEIDMYTLGNTTPDTPTETVNILETYTFEEFLALSEEEITALSQEAGEHYADGAYLSEANRSMSGWPDDMMQPIYILITEDYSNAIFNQYNSYELSREQTFEEFMLPQIIDASGWEAYTFEPGIEIEMQIDSAAYSDYECTDVLASVYTWLWMNPNVESVSLSMLGFGDTTPDTPTETVNIFESYTFEEFLALSAEEICAISEEASKAYAFYEANSSSTSDAFILHVVIDESYKDSDMSELFMYPDDMITGGYECEAYIGDDDVVYAECIFDFETYLTNSGNYYDLHLRNAITAWFYLNPISLLCRIETPAGPAVEDTTPDTPTETVNILETYTFEEFLALSAEEICAISEEVADAYKSYEKESSNDSANLTLNVWMDKSYTNSSMETLFMLPFDIECSYSDVGYDNGNEYDIITFNFDNCLSKYSDYDSLHLKSVIKAWISLNPIAAFCFIEETTEKSLNILETYTFEEFLDLSEEEITALSQEAGKCYAEGAKVFEANRIIGGCTDRMLQGISVYITEDYSNAIFNQYNSYELSPEQTFEEFMLPQTIVPLKYETYSFKYEDEIEMRIDSAVYSDYECIDVLASVYTWLWMNPNVESMTTDMYALGNTTPDTPTETVNIFETYTFEEFLALSAEEICAISEEVAEDYNINITHYNSTLYEEVLPCINVVTYDTYETITEQSDALGIPADLMDISGSTTNFHITMKWDNHTDDSYADFVAKTYTWLDANPKVELLTNCSMCLLATKPDTTENHCGDIDQNDTIDISDATASLTIYANAAAGLSTDDYTEQQRSYADVNEDSTVDLSDATAILTYYAQTAAGLQPVWEQILA